MNSRNKQLPKILLHEHLDCSPRPKTLLTLWDSLGFEKARIPFPSETIADWYEARVMRERDGATPAVLKLEEAAAEKYRSFITGYAKSSLANYVNAIVDHVLPVMQTSENIILLTKERIEDAVEDGIVAMELRFAPQLHLSGVGSNGSAKHLDMEGVMEAVIKGLENSPIPVKLILCALRHEHGKYAEQLRNLAVKYKDHVGAFDLAADEKANPGVLKWWLEQALIVREHGIGLTIHLWETNEPTDEDVEILNKHKITRLGHGIHGNRQEERFLEICPTSNVVTAEVESYESHPVGRLHKEGKKITINTDGTLFTNTTLSKEYDILQKYFGFTESDFFEANLNALEASSFNEKDKVLLRKKLESGYKRN